MFHHEYLLLKNIRGLQDLYFRLVMSDIVKINEVNLRKNEIIRKWLIPNAIHPTEMKLVLNI